jgi:peroxiredoxin
VKIEQYIKNFPRDEAIVDLIVDVASTAEMMDQIPIAKQAYELVAQHFKKHELNERLPAIKARLDLAGKKYDLQGDSSTLGKKINTADMKDKVVIVLFWESASQPCLDEIDNLRNLYKQYHPYGLEIVGVPLDDDSLKLQKTLTEQKVQWLNLAPPMEEKDRGPNHPQAKKYGIVNMPTMFLLDKSGKIVSTNARGPVLDGKLAQLLNRPMPPKLGERDELPAGIPPK